MSLLDRFHELGDRAPTRAPQKYPRKRPQIFVGRPERVDQVSRGGSASGQPQTPKVDVKTCGPYSVHREYPRDTHLPDSRECTTSERRSACGLDPLRNVV